MAALSAAFDGKRRDGRLVAQPLAAGVRIYKGALAICYTSVGYVGWAQDTGSAVFAGVASETVDNTAGANGAKSVRLEKTGVFVFNAQGVTATDLGKPAFIVDDNTVKTAATANSIAAGIVVGVIDATHLAIRIDGKVN